MVKYLLIALAFATLGCNRKESKDDIEFKLFLERSLYSNNYYLSDLIKSQQLEFEKKSRENNIQKYAYLVELRFITDDIINITRNLRSLVISNGCNIAMEISDTIPSKSVVNCYLSGDNDSFIREEMDMLMDLEARIKNIDNKISKDWSCFTFNDLPFELSEKGLLKQKNVLDVLIRINLIRGKMLNDILCTMSKLKY